MPATSLRRAPEEIRQDLVNEIFAAVQKDKNAKRTFAGGQDILATEVSVAASVGYVGTLAKPGRPIWGVRKQNIDAVRGLKKRITDLKRSLKRTPDAALFLLFAADVNGLSDAAPSTDAQQAALVRFERTMATLIYLDARCDQILRTKPGKHASTDHLKHLCAEESWRLLRSHGVKPASGVFTSVLNRIASLLYESAKGKFGEDLERACKDTLRAASAGEISDRGRSLGSARLLPQ
jgi:hypothetical protein